MNDETVITMAQQFFFFFAIIRKGKQQTVHIMRAAQHSDRPHTGQVLQMECRIVPSDPSKTVTFTSESKDPEVEEKEENFVPSVRMTGSQRIFVDSGNSRFSKIS